MRALLVAGLVMLVLSGSALGQGTNVAPRSDLTPEGKAPAEMIGMTLSAVQARLLEIKGQYSQLSEFADARLSNTGLEYEKEEMSWPKGKVGGPHFSKKDGCYLRVAFRYPLETEPMMGAMDQGMYFPSANLFCPFFLFSDAESPEHDAFERAVRDIVMQECAKLAEQLSRAHLEKVCTALKSQSGGEWEPDRHSAFPDGVLVVRGRFRDASDKAVAEYVVLPVGAGADPLAQKALGLYGKSGARTSVLGLGPRFTVVEILRGREDESVEKARGAVARALELSPPKVTVEMYRAALSVAEGALETAQAKALHDIAPARTPSIAVGQMPFIQERDGAFRFVWEMITSSKTGYRVAVERAKDGKVSVLEVKVGI